MEIDILGIDLAKHIFQLHGAERNGRAVHRSKVVRGALIETVQKLRPRVVAMEACSSAHHWARRFIGMGIEVRLISPQYVTPFVKTNKNDRNDAEAIAEAASRPSMRFVSVKSVEQASGYPSGRLFVDGIESALAALLVSGYADVVPSSTHLDCTLPPARVKLVEKFARANLHVPLTLKDLAECAGYSPSHFSRSFRGTFGTTPHRFMVGLRAERAKELLKHSRLSTLEIALHCGFQTSQHFPRVFKCLAGVSPSDFRNRG